MDTNTETRTAHRCAKYSIPAALFVTLAFWCIQTDNFPVLQTIRPSWYVYGWPVCFATSSRGRFNLSSFDSISLAVDLSVTVLTIACTWTAARNVLKRLPHFSIVQLIAVTTGFALVCFVTSDAMNATVDSLGFQLPHEDASATAGNARRWERYSLFSQLPLGLGVLSVGYVFTVAFAQRFNLDNTSVDETELQDVK